MPPGCEQVPMATRLGTDADTTYLHRFAGHVETRAPGISDPAIETV